MSRKMCLGSTFRLSRLSLTSARAKVTCMSAINAFLLKNNLRIAANPCVSPDFCLDWAALRALLQKGGRAMAYEQSRFETKAGSWTLLEDPVTGDCAWRLQPGGG